MQSIHLARLEARRARAAATDYQRCRTVLLPTANRQGSKLFKAGVMRRLNRLAAEYRRATAASLRALAAHRAESQVGINNPADFAAKFLSPQAAEARRLSDAAGAKNIAEIHQHVARLKALLPGYAAWAEAQQLSIMGLEGLRG
jgi:hypothetical protein